MRVRAELESLVRAFVDDERPVADEILWLVPCRSERVAVVPGPGERPGRSEYVREVAAGLAQRDFEGSIVERLRRLDVGQHGCHPEPVLADPPPGVDEVLGREGHAVTPAQAFTKPEEIRPPVLRHSEVVGQVGKNVRLLVDRQEPPEEMLCDLHLVRRVDVPRRECRRTVEGRLEALGRNEPWRLFHAAAERFVQHLLSPLEIKCQMVRERHLEERVPSPSVVTHPGKEDSGPAVMVERNLIGMQRPRGISCLEEVFGGFLRLVGLAEVPGQHLESSLGLVTERVLEGLTDVSVHPSALAVQQACVGNLLDEAVAEPVLRRGSPSLLDDEIESLQLGQGRDGLVARHDPFQKGEPERSAYDCRVAQHLPCQRVESVEPRLQGSLDDRRDDEVVWAHCENELATLVAECPALDQVAQRFLEEERIPAGANCEQLGDGLRQLRLGRVRGERPACIVWKRPQFDLPIAVRMPLACPLTEPPRPVVAFAAIEEQEADRCLLCRRQKLLDELEARVVSPLEVVEDEAEWPLARESAAELGEELEGLSLDALAARLTQPFECIGLQLQAQQAADERVRGIRLFPE